MNVISIVKEDWFLICEMASNVKFGVSDIGSLLQAIEDARQDYTDHAKLEQAKTFILGLHKTPDNATIGNLRSFIDSNFESISKD